jgi:hypothetical protein
LLSITSAQRRSTPRADRRRDPETRAELTRGATTLAEAREPDYPRRRTGAIRQRAEAIATARTTTQSQHHNERQTTTGRRK